MMHLISRAISRRQLLDQVSIAAASVIAIGLGAPSQAAAPTEAPSPLPGSLEKERRARVAEQWEDVLLLAAVRYLDLSKTQIEAMLELAKDASERLEKLKAQEEEKLALLEPLVQQVRVALLGGDPAKRESDAVLSWRFLQQTRERVENDIIQHISTRLVRVLSRQQVLLAYLLARGGALPTHVSSVALLDSRSGFVVDDTTRHQWREAFVNQQLARLYSPAILKIDGNLAASRRDLNGEVLTPEEELATQAATKRSELETDWFVRWDDPKGRAMKAGSEEEQSWALYHFVRRMFLSPRISPVLTELVGHAM